MATGESVYAGAVRDQLLAGRERLTEVLDQHHSERTLQLLEEVDAALHRIDHGLFGVCEVCNGTVEAERMEENPLARVCLDCMTPQQQRALEYDLELAAQIQKGLLPPRDPSVPGWGISYHYQPAGVVGGDYCDIIPGPDGWLYFVLADVSGKGVAAAMLSSNLRATLRSLVPLGLPLRDLVVRTNRLFRESALPTQYATLAIGRASADGRLELVNAGHLPGLLTGDSGFRMFESTCKPLGIFSDDEVCIATAQMQAGDMLVLYSDGVSETSNSRGEEYGIEAVKRLVSEMRQRRPSEMVAACRQRLADFRGAGERADDETLLAMQYTPWSTAGASAVV